MANLTRLCFEDLCSTIPETYTKIEVDEIVNNLETSSFEVVSELPQTGETHIIYLLPNQSNGYDQYIYIEADGWIKIGTTTMTLDKQSILNALGYEETTISMTDVDNVTVTKTILVKIEE